MTIPPTSAFDVTIFTESCVDYVGIIMPIVYFKPSGERDEFNVKINMMRYDLGEGI